MLRYFCEGLKSSILAKLEYQDLKLENFNQMVKKTINIKAKAVLQSYSNTREINQHCPYGNRLVNFTITKSQSSIIKDLWVEEPKIRGSKRLSGPKNSNKPSKKAWKKMEKKQRQRD